MRLGGCFAALLVLAASSARAETLVETYRVAISADPRLGASRSDHEASTESRRAALAGLLPTLRADAERTRERQDIISSRNPVIGAGTSEFSIEQWSITLTQPLFRLGAFERLRQSDFAERQAFTQRVATEQALMVRVATAYLAVLAAQDNLGFATSERVAVGRSLQFAEERVTRGLATVANLHDARSRFAQTEAQEIEGRNTLDDAQHAMSEILGRMPTGYFPLRQEIPAVAPDPTDPGRWVDTAQRQNLGLEAKRLAAEVAYQEIRRQRSAYAPTLDLVGSIVNRKQGGTLFGGGSHVETTDLTLRLAIPIYEGGLTTALTDEAVARHRKALHELEQERRAVERQTRAAYQGVVGAISRVRALQQGVTSQDSSLKAKQEGLRAGLLTLLPVLDAERDLYLAHRDYARARYDYLLNRLRLKQSTGSLSESDLEAIDQLLQRS